MNPQRRQIVLATLAGGAVLLTSGCSTLEAVGALLGNQLNFSQGQLQQALDRNFPKHYDKMGGLISMTLLNPRLSIPQGSSRLRLDFDLGMGALGSDSSRADGHFALTSALRWDGNTRGLHLQEPALEHVEVPALGGVMNSSARGLLNTWLAQYARDEPVYRFDNTLLDRLGSRRIGRTDIENGQVTVHLDN
ncbi:DUF1439 domain-containing protein [Agrilutibacter solisilvae]|uniref:DUF1439 domain-containing protein n=1 Tax=Agrilutibacter solisilvae TaxID=2763317 RepID=A0A974Y527_9GAMM|nr:DUF1439 domain-containing protein [Lysobacter solisilvae]QSX78361.1 DUF1439 domain-containing protein [Lysobacter solisilvae]